MNLKEEREAIVRDFGNKLAMQLTPSNEAMNVVRWAREELITALLSHEEKVVARVKEEVLLDVESYVIDMAEFQATGFKMLHPKTMLAFIRSLQGETHNR